MRLTCLILLAIMSVLSVTECKPISDGVGTAPCVDCEQKQVRSKRSPFFPLFFPPPPIFPVYWYPTQQAPNVINQITNVNNVSVNGPGTVDIRQVTNNNVNYG